MRPSGPASAENHPERLYDCLTETENAAQRGLETIVSVWDNVAGATEALKAADQMKWAGIVNAREAQAEEASFREIIFA